MRLLIAARLSKMNNGQTGIDTQDAGVRAWAEANGHTIVHVAADKKSGGTTHPWERPNLRPWVTDPHLIAQYDAVVAFKLDRLSRGDDESTTAIEDWAREHKKQLLTADGLYYPCEGADGIRWDVMKRLAHQEWLSISERYRRMQKHLRDNGFLAGGHVPFGYRVVRVEGTDHKTLEPDPVNAVFVRQAIDRYLSGDSLRTVCAWLDSQDVKPWWAKSWSPKSLQTLFRNPVLMGRSCNAAGQTILRVKPLLKDVGTWHRLQAEMDRKAGRTGVVNPTTAMLTSIAQCAICGGPMYRHKISRKRVDGTKSVHLYYRCHGTERNPSTCKNMISLDKLEAFVDRQMTTGPQGREQYVDFVKIPGGGYGDEIAEIERDIRELDLDDPEYLAKQAALRGERMRLKSLPAVPDRIELREMGITVAEHWASLDELGRRAYLVKHAAELEVDRGNARLKIAGPLKAA